MSVPSSASNSPRTSIVGVTPVEAGTAGTQTPAAQDRRTFITGRVEPPPSRVDEATLVHAARPRTLAGSPVKSEQAEAVLQACELLRQETRTLVQCLAEEKPSEEWHSRWKKEALYAVAWDTFPRLMAMGMTYVEIKAIFDKELGVALSSLTSGQLHVAYGEIEWLQEEARSSTRVTGREVAGALVKLDLYGLWRGALEKERSGKKVNPMLKAFRAGKDQFREWDAEHGKREKFLSGLATQKAREGHAVLVVESAVRDFKAARPDKKIEAVGKTVQSLFKFAQECANDQEIERYVAAAFLQQDPDTVKAYAQMLSEPQLLGWMTKEQQSLLGVIRSAVESVGVRYPDSVSDTPGHHGNESRPRELSLDGKDSPELHGQPPHQAPASDKIRGAASFLGLALSRDREVTGEQQKAFNHALDKTSEAVKEALKGGMDPGVAFKQVEDGVREVFDRVKPTQAKNAAAVAGEFELKARLEQDIVKREVAQILLGRNLRPLDRTKRDDQHAWDAFNATGLNTVAVPVLKAFRAVKNLKRSADNTYGPAKAHADAIAAQEALRKDATAKASKAAAATQINDADEREEQLLVGICVLLEVQPSQGVGLEEDRIRAAMENALIRMPRSDINALEEALRNDGDDGLMRYVMAQLRDEGGPATWAPRLNALRAAIGNVLAVYR